MKESFCSDCTDADIRDEAYRLFLASGRIPGRDLENWLLAEQRVRSRRVHADPSAAAQSMLRFPLNEHAICRDTPHPFSPRS